MYNYLSFVLTFIYLYGTIRITKEVYIMFNIVVSYSKAAEFLETIAGSGYFVTAADVTEGGIRYTIIKKEVRV